MRTEQEMMDLILNTAKEEDRIRGVIMNGSRVANHLYKDCFQDYDIVYLVKDFDYFVNDHSWIERFGERIILEMPAYKDLEPNEYNDRFNYQMLFRDGNRLDLTLATLDKVEELVSGDPIGRVLLDKDGILKNVKWGGPEVYLVMPPTKREFENSCNSFWWILQNIAKGLKRGELPYALQMFNYAREDLNKMVTWYIGLKHEYQVSAGKMGKYFELYLEKKHWEQYRKTYPQCEESAIWEAVFVACDFYRSLAVELAENLSYEYPNKDDEAMTVYLREVRRMDYQRELL
jgi:aminoglycoside 6-adenylyltransferase